MLTTNKTQNPQNLRSQIKALEFAKQRAKNQFPIDVKIRQLKLQLEQLENRNDWNDYLAR